jgi:hypothetical protein
VLGQAPADAALAGWAEPASDSSEASTAVASSAPGDVRGTGRLSP